MDKKPIIVEEFFNLSVEVVWKAITEVDQMKQWFFESIKSFEPKLGFHTQFNVETPDRNFVHLWEILAVEPLKKIVYSWKYEGFPGESQVTFEISEIENQTKLQVSHIGIETFPSEIPEFSRESCMGGWNYFIKERLNKFLKR